MNKRKTVGYTMIVAGITALLCIAVFVFCGYQFFLKPSIEFEPDQSKADSSQSSNGDNIAIPGFESWTINAGTTKASSDFYNPEKNNCYFVVSVILDDTDEIIYESKYIKPGQHLYEIKLNKTMKKGTYKATLHYSTYSMDDLTPLNGADVPFELIVK